MAAQGDQEAADNPAKVSLDAGGGMNGHQPAVNICNDIAAEHKAKGGAGKDTAIIQPEHQRHEAFEAEERFVGSCLVSLFKMLSQAMKKKKKALEAEREEKVSEAEEKVSEAKREEKVLEAKEKEEVKRELAMKVVHMNQVRSRKKKKKPSLVVGPEVKLCPEATLTVGLEQPQHIRPTVTGQEGNYVTIKTKGAKILSDASWSEYLFQASGPEVPSQVRGAEK